MEEHRRRAITKVGPHHEKVKTVDEYLKGWRADAKRGVYTYYDPVIVSARKPEST